MSANCGLGGEVDTTFSLIDTRLNRPIDPHFVRFYRWLRYVVPSGGRKDAVEQIAADRDLNPLEGNGTTLALVLISAL